MAQQKKIRMIEFMRQTSVTSRRGWPYKRKWLNNAKMVELFEKHLGVQLYSNSFSGQMMDSYIYWLKSQPKSYKSSTIKSFGQKLGEALRKAATNGYLVDFGFQETDLPEDEVCSVFLDEIEIESIFNLQKISKEAHAVRERFVVACCTGMRFSDISELTADNLHAGVVKMKTRKTVHNVEIPQHWMVVAILKRNNGVLPPLKTAQAFNTMIKRICKKAGIIGNVLYERMHGLKMVRKMVKKYMLVSSHTARRSLATNMHLRGIQTGRIMLLTGHKTEQAFFKYIRINRTENARTLSEHPFFKGG